MGLVRMSELFKRAASKGIGVGSFSVYSLEAMMGVIKAAEDSETPIIIQLAEARFHTAPLELVGSMMMNAARTSKVDIAVHLDHGNSFDVIEKALQMGFSSVMYDGSAKSFEENVRNTKIVQEMAEAFHADVEAELGLVGRSEDGLHDYGIQCTQPEDAEAFVKETKVDALAIAIGNQHGNYPASPKLRFDILNDIHKRIPQQALVLHGGSGISDGDFQECIKNGIVKINIATAVLNSMVKEAEQYFQKETEHDYYGLNRRMVQGAYETAMRHIHVFNMK